MIMDFAELKKKALELKDQAVEKSKEAVDYGAKKLWESAVTLKTKKELEDFVASSKNTKTKMEDGTQKENKKRVVIIFTDTKSDFFESMLYMLPVLITKAFSQNVSLKLADISMKDMKKTDYNIKKWPTLVVFENTKLLKTLEGEENIQKVVKSATLDINATIDNI